MPVTNMLVRLFSNLLNNHRRLDFFISMESAKTNCFCTISGYLINNRRTAKDDGIKKQDPLFSSCFSLKQPVKLNSEFAISFTIRYLFAKFHIHLIRYMFNRFFLLTR